MLAKLVSMAVFGALSVAALPTPRPVDASVRARTAQADTGSNYNDDNGDSNGDGILSGNSAINLVEVGDVVNTTSVPVLSSVLRKRQADEGEDYNNGNGGTIKDGNGNGVLSGNSDISLLDVGDILKERQADDGTDYNDGNGDDNGDSVLAGNSDINLLEVGDILKKRQADNGTDYNDDNGDNNGDGILSGNSDDTLIDVGDVLDDVEVDLLDGAADVSL